MLLRCRNCSRIYRPVAATASAPVAGCLCPTADCSTAAVDMDPILDGDLLAEGLAGILVPADILAVWVSPRRVGPNGQGSAVVFLDFDGTLISDADSAAGGKLASGTGPGSRTVNWRFQTEATAALRQLAEAAPAASSVISSSWRVHGPPTISRLFAANGC